MDSRLSKRIFFGVALFLLLCREGAHAFAEFLALFLGKFALNLFGSEGKERFVRDDIPLGCDIFRVELKMARLHTSIILRRCLAEMIKFGHHRGVTCPYIESTSSPGKADCSFLFIQTYCHCISPPNAVRRKHGYILQRNI